MPSIRTFIAIRLTDEVRQLLARVQSKLASQVDADVVRWGDKDSVHLTLKFLGDVSSDRLPVIHSAVERACQNVAPFAISVEGLGCFPSTRRPRVVWVGVRESGESLQRLQRAIEDALAEEGFERDRRGFTPHLTLGRLRRQASRGDVERLGRVVEQGVTFPALEMGVASVSVMKSELRPSGAVYTQLKQVSL